MSCHCQRLLPLASHLVTGHQSTDLLSQGNSNSGMHCEPWEPTLHVNEAQDHPQRRGTPLLLN
uniref:Uncharacterized protein n=1 Tax=Arundo donax TaxID=35708 RepID=A0A0A9DAG1_ARUDO